MNNTATLTQPIVWRAYWELCKPKVVALMLLTAIVGMFLADPTHMHWQALIVGLLGIGLCAGSAAAINHIVDAQIDIKMARTKARPIPTGKISTPKAISFALILAVSGSLLLICWVNLLTAILTLVTVVGYAFFYTLYLKRATPQNIVIGGAAGAAPPILGWTAITGHLDPNSLLLALIIFAWTPPHFWALAIYRYEDYKRAEIPMLPVTHGIAFTKLAILLYTFLLVASSLFPFIAGMNGWIYLAGALLLGLRFVYWSWRLKKSSDPIIAMKTFRYSITYLMVLFLVMLMDRYCLMF
jgi:protoheme IX farnesyltransferase